MTRWTAAELGCGLVRVACCLAVTGCHALGFSRPGEAEKAAQAPRTADAHTSSSDSKTGTATARRVNSLQMAFRLMPAGTLKMGTAANPSAPLAGCESPQHTVRLSRAFWIGEHEVTVGQFRQFVAATGTLTDAEQLGTGVFGLDLETGKVEERPAQIWTSPGFPQTDAHPVVAVSWNDAQAFCRWLSEKEGVACRLPTEAEWEYACRAGSDAPYSCGEWQSLREAANIGDLELRSRFSGATGCAPWNDGFAFTAPVGSFQPNAFGLYDLHGNVGEWCQDWFDAGYYARSPAVDPRGPEAPTAWRVVRGGSWYNSAPSCRSASRHDCAATAPSTTNGFRVVIDDAPQAMSPDACARGMEDNARVWKEPPAAAIRRDENVPSRAPRSRVLMLCRL